MIKVLVKAVAIWCLMVLVAIINGLLRDEILTPLLSSNISLPVSGITLSILILLLTYASIAFIGVTRAAACFMVGLLWLVLTLIFEYAFGHYVAGKSWFEINQVFDLTKGDLFIVVLIVFALSPWLTARLKGLI